MKKSIIIIVLLSLLPLILHASNKSIETPLDCFLHLQSYGDTINWVDLSPGDICIGYFDPTECNYGPCPFEIRQITARFIHNDQSVNFSQLDLVIYELAEGGLSCDGPGMEMNRYQIDTNSFTTYLDNNGNKFIWMSYYLPVPCTTFTSFYVGYQVTDYDSSKVFPSPFIGPAASTDACRGWYNGQSVTNSEWQLWDVSWPSLQNTFPSIGVSGYQLNLNCAYDSDWDDIPDTADNCVSTYNPDQINSDDDEFGDLCDNCPYVTSPDQSDPDNDGIGNPCDICIHDDCNDEDADGICGDVDNCPSVYNPDQTDSDENGKGDVCESCCEGPIRGNIDGSPDDNIDIGDLVWLITYMFGNGPEPPCFEEGDLNGDGEINIADPVDLIGYMFGLKFPHIAACPYASCYTQ